MKKLLLPILSIAIYTISFGASIEIKPMPDANEIFLTFGKAEKKISLVEFSKISVMNFKAVTSREMNFFDRIVFMSMQKKLKKSITENGAIKKEKLSKFLKRFDRGEAGFHLGGFILGVLLGPVGVLISYLIKDDYKRRRVKWSWIGFAAWGAILIFIAFYQSPVP